ncbi:MAG: zinc ribbon domain-containing protein [Candidatus Hodarchaeota archaeon]
MTNCSNCGSVLKEGAKFCTNCGYKIEQLDTTQPPRGRVITTPQRKGKIIMKGGGMTTLYKVIAYFVGVFIFDLFISWAICAGLEGDIACFWGFTGALYVPLLIFTPLLVAIAQSY